MSPAPQRTPTALLDSQGCFYGDPQFTEKKKISQKKQIKTDFSRLWRNHSGTMAPARLAVAMQRAQALLDFLDHRVTATLR